MSEEKKQLTSEDSVVSALAAAIEQQALTPILEAGTVTVMGPRHDALVSAINGRQTAINNEAILVTNTEVAGDDLETGMKNYIKELNGNIKKRVGGNPKSVRALFGLNVATGRQPSMSSQAKKLLVAGKIKDGNVEMIAGGFVLNVAFTAADVLGLRNTFNDFINDKSTAKTAVADGEDAVEAALPPALETANDIPRQVKNFYRALTPSAIRDKERLFGCNFLASKELTDIKVIVKLPASLAGAGALVRIGEVLTKAGKPAKEGINGTTDIDGMITLQTTVEGLTNIIVKLIGFADNVTPITIVAGTPQRITVTLVPGVSSL